MKILCRLTEDKSFLSFSFMVPRFMDAQRISRPENNKLCRLDYVQLEDDISYIKSSHTDLLSSN